MDHAGGLAAPHPPSSRVPPQGVARAKGELFAGARAGDVCVVNADDPRVAALPLPAGTRRVTFGAGVGMDLRLAAVEATHSG